MSASKPSDAMLAALADHFKPELVSWRVGSVSKGDKTKATALCYIDARDVMNRLDAACGPENWQDSYVETPRGRVICTIAIKVDGEWVSKSDGAGDTAVEGEKGGISDAFKRAAVKWGVGRYLYAIPTQWVRVDEHKRILRSEYAKLEKVLPGSRIAHDEEQNPDAPEAMIAGMRLAIDQAKTLAALADCWKRNQPVLKELTADEVAELTAYKDARKHKLSGEAA